MAHCFAFKRLRYAIQTDPLQMHDVIIGPSDWGICTLLICIYLKYEIRFSLLPIDTSRDSSWVIFLKLWSIQKFCHVLGSYSNHFPALDHTHHRIFDGRGEFGNSELFANLFSITDANNVRTAPVNRPSISKINLISNDSKPTETQT